jgi:hypothetical protein
MISFSSLYKSLAYWRVSNYQHSPSFVVVSFFWTIVFFDLPSTTGSPMSFDDLCFWWTVLTYFWWRFLIALPDILMPIVILDVLFNTIWYMGSCKFYFAACRCCWCNYALELSLGYDYSEGLLKLGLMQSDILWCIFCIVLRGADDFFNECISFSKSPALSLACIRLVLHLHVVVR